MTHTSSTSADMQPWYYRAFDELYPVVYRHRDSASARREIAGLLKTLSVHGSERALDVACGEGRHLTALLDAGLDAFGVDLSGALLKRAAENPGLRGRLVRADVRDLPFAPSFDLVVNLFTSFGYFDDDENLRALRRMASVIKRGGRLVLDHVHRDHLQRHLVANDCQQVKGLTVKSRRRIEDSRMIKHVTVTHPDSRVDRITESVRLYDPDEMTALFESAGLKVQRILGSFDGGPLEHESERMIVIGCRA